MIKVVFMDVDDTITESTKPISDKVADTLNSLLEKGTKLVFISGSTVDQIYQQITPKLKYQHTLMGTSGSHCVEIEYENGKPLRRPVFWHGLSVEDIEVIIDAFDELVIKYNLQPLTNRADQIQDRGSQVTFSVLGRGAPSADKKAFDPDGSRRRAWVQEIREKVGYHLSYNVGGSTSIDVTMKGANKGTAITEYLNLADYKARDCVFFGDRLEDGGNDHPVRYVLNHCVPVTGPENFLELIGAWV